jgi:hypothetical protein
VHCPQHREQRPSAARDRQHGRDDQCDGRPAQDAAHEPLQPEEDKHQAQLEASAPRRPDEPDEQCLAVATPLITPLRPT